MKLLPGLLQNLIDSLDEHHLETKKHFTDSKIFNLMKQICLFPYSLLHYIRKLKIDKFSSRSDFFSTLNKEYISICTTKEQKLLGFICKKMGKYFVIYLKTDVLLLSDVFESFKNRCIDKYNVDPCYYYTGFVVGCKVEIY